ncbi:MAG TPA: CHAT domain-containing protein [Thermoanaerobaculia bacterium]
MARPRGIARRLIAPLVVVLMLTASHHDAAQSPWQSAYRAARAALDRGETAQATALVDRVLGSAQTCSDADSCALLMLRAELAFRTTNIEAARLIIKRALPANAKDSEAAVYRLILLGRDERKQEYFDAARAIATKHHPRLLPIVAVSEISRVTPADKLDSVAYQAIKQARALKDGAAEVRITSARAYALNVNGRFAEAIAGFEAAVEAGQKFGLVPTVATAQGNMGWAYLALGDVDNAAEFFERADQTSRAHGLIADGLQWILQRGNVAEERGDYATALQRFSETLAFARQVGSEKDIAEALQNLANIALRQKRLGDARKLNAEATALKKKLKMDLVTAIMADAEIAERSGQLEHARELLEGVAEKSKTKSVVWEARGRLARVYLAMNRTELAEQQFRQAIATVREAREALGDAKADLRLAFLSRAIEILDPYLDFLISQGRTLDALAAVDAYRAQTLEEELGVTRPRTLNPQAIAKNANATILSYWLGEQRSYLWVITPERVTLRTLPLSGTAINTAADAYQRELRGRRGTLAQSGAGGIALYQMLIEPAGAIARDARVVVIPDGRLHNINFETLVVRSPKPHYWIEDVIVTTARSLQLLAEAPKTAPQSPKMLLVGDPPEADPAFPKLKHAALEIDAIQQQFDQPAVLRGAQATPSAYAAAKPGTFDYLHFVAHGVATRQKPLDSAVILARDKNSRYRLSAREIVKTPLRAKLVTVSSCYGAGSRTYGGEGLVGLAWAFLGAGADQVIAALWEVDDETTAGLMKQMYEEIRKGHDPAIALRSAKLSLLRSGTIRAKPSHWAPFVLYAGR